MGVTGAAIELAAMHKVENGHGIVSEPYHDRPGRKAAEGGEGVHRRRAPALTVVAGRRRLGAVASGTLLAAGSLLTRFGVFDAGMASAKDPKYTVIPQKERLAARQNGPHRHPLTCRVRPAVAQLRALQSAGWHTMPWASPQAAAERSPVPRRHPGGRGAARHC